MMMATQSIASRSTVSISEPSEAHIDKKKLHISEITPEVYLGSLVGAASLVEKNEQGFTHVLSCIEHDLLPKLPEGIQTLHIEVSDEFGHSLAPHFANIIQFIQQARAENGKVFVHCEMGRSRSAAAVIAYLIACEGKSLKEAKLLVQEKRPIILINPWFAADLLDLYFNHPNESH
jgi:protein-tyrosine phosphatase